MLEEKFVHLPAEDHIPLSTLANGTSVLNSPLLQVIAEKDDLTLYGYDIEKNPHFRDQPNYRAGMVADAIPTRGHSAPIYGDCWLRCPEELAQRLMATDRSAALHAVLHTDMETFLLGWAADNETEPKEVMFMAERVMEKILADLHQTLKESVISKLAQALGVDASVVDVMVMEI